MKNSVLIAMSVFTGLLTCCNNINGPSIKVGEYPITEKVNQVDTYFGTKVPDPYRWLEDDNSPKTADWVKAQNKVTFGYLAQIPFRDKIKRRLGEIWNYPKYSVPQKKGEYYFSYKNDGMQNQSVLYVQKGLSATPTVLLDPNTLSKDGTTALGGTAVSNDKKYMAYSISKGGSDWEEIHVMDIATGKTLDDVIKWVKFSGIAWQKDGFYYSRYDEPKEHGLSKKNEFHKVYYHKVGSPQARDVLVYENKNEPLRNYGAQVTEDERFFILSETQSTSGNALYVKDLTQKNAELKNIVKSFENEYNVIDNIGDQLLVQTNKNAPRYRLVLIDPAKPDEKDWKEIIPQQQNVLQGVSLAKDKIIVQYMQDAVSRIFIYNREGKQENELPLPGIGTVDGLGSDKNDSLVFVGFTTFTAPESIYKYNTLTQKTTLQTKPKLDFKSEDYETKQVFYPSKDGTKIPMFIVHKKGIELNGQNPTLLFGYGGFNISKTPEFKPERLVFLENGGIFAMPNLRGGGEYGEEWHKAGTKLQKQNVFDDFISAAEYLIKEKYTSPEKLAISGRSNGGLLTGATLTQRPDLFRVAVPVVGVMDMLRFHKFTIGWSWTGDYGSSDDSAQFQAIYKYSPLHNVKEGMNYPATLITTGDHDDRVVPAHSFKFASTMQEKYKGTNPILIRIDTMAGHGSGKPTAKLIEEQSDVFSFMMYNLGMKVE